MKSHILLVLFLALTGFTLLPVWSGLTTPEATAAQDYPGGKITRVVAPIDADGVQRLEVIGGEYYYTPNQIVVKVNTPVELKFKKTGGYIPHNVIAKAPEAGIDFKVDLKNDLQTVTFTPTKTGKYPLYCDKSFLWFATHREKGMEGVIEVVE